MSARPNLPALLPLISAEQGLGSLPGSGAAHLSDLQALCQAGCPAVVTSGLTPPQHARSPAARGPLSGFWLLKNVRGLVSCSHVKALLHAEAPGPLLGHTHPSPQGRDSRARANVHSRYSRILLLSTRVPPRPFPAPAGRAQVCVRAHPATRVCVYLCVESAAHGVCVLV